MSANELRTVLFDVIGAVLFFGGVASVILGILFLTAGGWNWTRNLH